MMNKYKSSALIGLAVASLFASQAFATGCPNAPATGNPTYPGPVCIAPLGLDGAGHGLQDELNSLTTSGTAVNVYNDQAGPHTSWSIPTGSGNLNTILMEIAGYAGSNTFGIYDLNNKSNTLELFDGLANAGDTALLTYNGSGIYSTGFGTLTFGSMDQFGYYLSGPGGMFYSDPLLNTSGMQQFVEYQGNGSWLQTGASQTKFDSSKYLLAWEDLPFSKSDLDYNDFVVLVQATPKSTQYNNVPEPAALGVFGLGVLLIGLFAGLRRRPRNA